MKILVFMIVMKEHSKITIFQNFLGLSVSIFEAFQTTTTPSQCGHIF